MPQQQLDSFSTAPMTEEIENFIYNIDPKQGLDDKQVKLSRAKFGKNSLTAPPRKPLWIQFLEKFKDPTIILLSVAAVISILVGFHTGKFIEGVGIIFAIILATGLSFYSEYKSGKEFDILNEVKEETAKVRRNGAFHVVPIEDLVVGDVVYLDLGDRVPADGRLVKTTGLYVDQSLLTGESKPVKKSMQVESGEKKGTFPQNLVFRGTLISDGSGVFIVTKVGDNTEMGKIASSLASQEESQTPLQERLEVLSKQIGYVGMTMAGLIFLALVFLNWKEGRITGWNLKTFEELIQYFMVAVTIIVVAVPEGLPMMVTMSLAFNMRKMAKSNCLVKKLEASETIGSVTVICSDKTGTLTRNQMRLVWFYVGGQAYTENEMDEFLEKPEWNDIIKNAAINSTANLEFDSNGFRPVGNATEAAILGFLHKLWVSYSEIRDDAKIVRQIPFSSERKKMITVIEEEDGFVCYEKGAPGILVEECSYIMIGGQIAPMEDYRESIQSAMEEASRLSYRLIAFTKKYLDGPCSEDAKCCDVSNNHILLGLVGIMDPLRPEVADSVEACHKAGIDVKMVTGDNLVTAIAIAKECKILKNEEDIALNHEDFSEMSDEELEAQIDKIKVLARSRPLDKLRLVKSLHSRREVVGVTGDGTNDAPALRQADVGIAMGKTGTEVAKEASDIVLLDDNFKSIVSGILWGRTIYENIQRLIQFQLTVNVVALLVAFFGPLLGIEKLPLTVVQLLWVNIIMDTFAALALSAEPPRRDTMSCNPRKRDEHIITGSMMGFIGITGLFMTIALLILLKIGFLGGENAAEKLTILFTTFVMFQFWNEFNCRSLNYKQSPFEGLLENRMFIIIVSVIFIVQMLVVNFGGELFRTVPISFMTWLKIIGMTFFILPIGHGAKWVAYKLFNKH